MKTHLLAVCLATTLAAAGCNDDDNDTGNGVTNPGTGSGTGTAGGDTGGGGTTGCTQTTLSEGGEVALDRGALQSLPFTTATDGRLDVTVSWRNSTANIGAFVVSGGSCSEAQFQGQQCSFILGSGNDNPHQMSGRVPAGSYELLVQNFGRTTAQSEPVSAKVVLSAGEGCPEFPAPAPTPTPSS